jgi:enoyl-CoA hydratase
VYCPRVRASRRTKLALTCDLLVAASDAKFGMPEVAAGRFAAGGALVRLPRRLPYGVAIEFALTAHPMDAPAAQHYSLVTTLAEPSRVIVVAMALAEGIGRNATLGVHKVPS